VEHLSGKRIALEVADAVGEAGQTPFCGAVTSSLGCESPRDTFGRRYHERFANGPPLRDFDEALLAERCLPDRE
jgi:hypothetical protein